MDGERRFGGTLFLRMHMYMVERHKIRYQAEGDSKARLPSKRAGQVRSSIAKHDLANQAGKFWGRLNWMFVGVLVMLFLFNIVVCLL